MNLILPKHFTFLFLLILSSSAFSQKEMINKHVPSRTNFKQLSGDVALKDRFGNLYHPNEIAIKTNPTVTSSGSSGGGAPVSFAMPFPIKDSCPAGMFKIHFVDEPVSGTGFSVAAHRDVICEVFRDISRLIENQSGSSAPYINIMVASDTSITIQNSGISLPNGVNIVGTSFEPIKYNLKNAWMDNIIYTSIKNGKSAFINLMGLEGQLRNDIYQYTHGLLIVNFKNKTWYTNFNDTSSIPSTQDDLYTHTLQQALHMLGLSSNILQNGNARGGNNLYARYDNYLYKNTSSSKLFTYSSTTKQVTNTTALPFGCSSPNNIRFIGDSTNIHVYNDTPWNTNINLSNFSCAGSTCNTNYAKPNNNYVMVPCLQSGHTYIKRHPHQDEVYALCDLGYKLKTVSGVYAYGATASNNASQGNVYKTYNGCSEPCIAIGGHDTIIMDTLLACARNFSTKILTNDIPTSSIIPRMELLDSAQGYLTYNTTGFTFTPKPHFKYGEVRIVYFPQCNATAQLGNATYITIRYTFPPLPPCVANDECNYICYGTFEESDDPNLWHGFLIHEPVADYNTADLWHFSGAITCRRNVIDNYWADCNVIDSGCNLISYGIQPHINGGNQFMGIYAESGADVYTEGFHFKLKKPIYHDTTKKLKLKFLAKVFSGCTSSFKMIAVADDTMPIAPPNPIRPLVGFGKLRRCAQFCDTLGSIDLTADTWAYYSIPINLPKVGDSFTNIIIMSDVALFGNEPKPNLHYCYFDNFEIYDSLDTRAVIASNPHSLIPCNDTTQTIDYYVCLENSIGLNSDSIIVQVNLPYGFTIASGSDFDASGRYKIPIGTISNTICDTLKLKYTIDITKVATDRGHAITAGYTCHDYCVSEISDWVKVYPKNHAIAVNKVVNKSNPVVGDTVIFTYEVCNISPQNISDILFSDTFPSNLVPILYQTGPKLNGQILTYQLPLDSAYNVSTPRCIQFSCNAVVKSSCKIPTIAHIKSIANPCFKASDTLTLNAANTGSPVTAQIRPASAVWCGNNIPLQAVITNPSGTYTYQWLKDGTNIGTNSATHLATSNGLYNVRISQNGCSTLIEGKAFDNLFIVKDSFTHTKCTTNIGSIYVSPKNGVKPYTYAWSASSVTDSFRTGLSNGTYTVTVTDSIGCTKILNFTINRIYDTLTLVNKIVIHPRCTTQNGYIKLSSLGGSGTHSFLWNDGSTVSERIGLIAGNYYVTVTDAFGCYIKDTTVLTKANPTLTVQDSLSVSCGQNKGSIFLKPIPTGSIYTYLWQDGNTNQNRINVTSGTYSVIITDSFGCVGYDTFVINGMSQPLSIVDSFHHPKCNLPNGKIFTHVSGGVPPYTYTWAHSSTHLGSLTGLTPANYSVTITDAMGCLVVRNYNLIDQFVALEGYLFGGCVSGNTTNVKVTIVEGDRPLTYLWSNGSTDSFINNLNVTANPTVSVTITNPIGCNIVLTKTLNTSSAIAIGTGTAYPNSSSMVGVIAFGGKPYAINRKFTVTGTFTVDQSIGFENCDFEADAGAKIVVTNTSYPGLIDNYTSFIGCHFFSCGTDLWKGVELKHVWGINFGGLITFGSLIEDALYGLDFHSGELTGYDFTTKNCFIGILNRPSSGINRIRRSSTFIGCGLDSIKKPYTGIGSDYFNSTHDTVLSNSRRSYCGIEYNQTNLATINETMKFYNLSNGVIFNSVKLANVNRAYFENIYNDPKLRHKNLPNGIPMFLNSGAAIMFNGSLIYNLNVSHIDPNHLMIKNAFYGVASHGGNVSISNLKMENVYMGGFLNHANLNVNNTSVYAINSGYGYRQEITGTAGQSTNITNNFIQAGVGIGLYSGAGNTSSNGGTIGNNTIMSPPNSPLHYGIDMIDINNVIVADNYVATDNYFRHVAFNYEYCSGISEQYNSAEMPTGMRLFTIYDWATGAPTPFPVGYYYNFTEHVSKCNYANNMKIGVRYTGLCNNSDLVGTEINNHDIGIKIDNTVTLKDQINNGNAFLDTCNFEARSDQPPLNQTRFYVNQTSSSAMWAVPRFPNGVTNDLFVANGGTDNIDCAIPLPPIMPEEGQSLRESIQQNLLEFPEFEPQLLWQNHAWYYDYLMHRDSLSEGEETYLEDMSGTNIEKLNLLNQEEMELYQTSLTRLEQMKSIASQMKNNLNALANYSLVNLSLLDSPQLAQHKAQVQSVQSTIDFQDSLLQLLRLQGITTTQNQLDTLANQNSLLVPEIITDSLQQLFNALYYSTYALEQYILDAEQMAGFQFLASQCPLLNADAVFRSRAIVQSQADTIRRYSDEAICKAAGYEYKSTKNKKPFSKKAALLCEIYPNPANLYTMVKFNLIPEGRVTINISDLLGRTIYQYSDELNANNFEINTSNMLSGIYFVTISTQEKVILNTKLRIDNQ